MFLVHLHMRAPGLFDTGIILFLLSSTKGSKYIIPGNILYEIRKSGNFPIEQLFLLFVEFILP